MVLCIRNILKGRSNSLGLLLATSISLLSANLAAEPIHLNCTIDVSNEVHEMTIDIDQKMVKHNIGFEAPLTLYSSASEITVPLKVSEDELSYEYQMEPGGVDYIHSYKIIRDSLDLTYKESFRLEDQLSVNTHNGKCEIVENTN